jgi:hypothetical protein
MILSVVSALYVKNGCEPPQAISDKRFLFMVDIQEISL